MRPDPPAWVEPLFAELGKPRLAGSTQVSIAEEAIADQLSTFGYSVARQTFRASPRRLYAGSLLGAGMGWVALALLPLLFLPVDGWIVTMVGITAMTAVSLVSYGVASGGLPFDACVVQASNLLATRAREPRLWLVAHSDTKAQWLSLRGRVFATMLTAAGLILVIAVLLVRLAGPLPWWLGVPPLIVLLIGAAGLSRSPLHGESPGAVDNGSGVIAALTAAEELSDRSDVGVLITGAEEFGMEGARAWVKGERMCGEGFVNFDGIDGGGVFNVMTHAPNRQVKEAGVGARRLFQEMCAVLRERGHTVRDRPLPLGIFVDGAILARGGLPGVTVSRGTWKTLSVIHTPRDTIDRTDVRSAVDAGYAAAEVVRRIAG